jgi:hypothetical protein
VHLSDFFTTEALYIPNRRQKAAFYGLAWNLHVFFEGSHLQFYNLSPKTGAVNNTDFSFQTRD